MPEETIVLLIGKGMNDASFDLATNLAHFPDACVLIDLRTDLDERAISDECRSFDDRVRKYLHVLANVDRAVLSVKHYARLHLGTFVDDDPFLVEQMHTCMDFSPIGALERKPLKVSNNLFSIFMDDLPWILDQFDVHLDSLKLCKMIHVKKLGQIVMNRWPRVGVHAHSNDGVT